MSPIRSGLLACLSLALASCHSNTAPRDLDNPVFGRANPTSFLIETDRNVSIRDLARIARVIGTYKEFTPREVALIQQRLQTRFEDLVSIELQSMQPRINKDKRAAATKYQRQRAELRDNQAALARLEADFTAENARIESLARQQARERVLARLGNELALPVLTDDARSVVAFGRMEGEQFQVTSKAYEIDIAASRIGNGTKITKADGSTATIIGQPEVRVTSP